MLYDSVIEYLQLGRVSQMALTDLCLLGVDAAITRSASAPVAKHYLYNNILIFIELHVNYNAINMIS